VGFLSFRTSTLSRLTGQKGFLLPGQGESGGCYGPGLTAARRHTRTSIVNLGGGLATGMIGGSSAWRVEGAGLVGTGTPSYKGFRYPVEIISHCVWLYYRFPLSLRELGR
jgi:hypothetical protein